MNDKKPNEMDMIYMGMNSIIEVEEEGKTNWFFQSPFAFEGFPIDIGSTLREGGFSEAPFDSFNLALHIGDNPNHVLANRKRLADYLGVDATRLTCADQVHGLKAVRITEELIGAGALCKDTAIPACDAIFTDLPNVPLLLFTADCVPVCIYDAVHKAIAVIHAGWKGAIGRLPSITLAAMVREFSTNPADCHVFLGPSIGPNSFEVSQELADRFQEAEPELAELVSMIVRDGQGEATPHVNLWAFIEEDLVRQGVPREQVVIGGIDSLTDEHCFSYRREDGKTGRMALFVMIQD